MKKIGILVMFLLFFVSVVSAADFEIIKVKVDGVTVYEDGGFVDEGSLVNLERDGNFDVDVFVKGLNNSDDVRVKAWLGGYEYGDVEDKSGIFDVTAGVIYRKGLRLSIPDDIDASEDYTLHVEAYSDEESDRKSFGTWIKETRHSLKIQDVIVRPGNSVDAGSPLFVTVRVENLGDKKEEDIKVSVSIPGLGLSTRDYIDELAAHEVANEDEEDSESSDELFLRIPKDAADGDYTLKVNVEYDRGHGFVSFEDVISVRGVDEEKEEGKSLVVVDNAALSASQGEEVSYKLTVLNGGEEAQIYSVDVSGEKLFASSSVDPSFILVQGGESGSLFVNLKAREDASQGVKSFVVKVKEGDTVISEVTLNLEIAGKAGLDTGNVLVLGFVVLIVILIILGIVLLFTRGGEPEEPGVEGQTYY